MKNHPVGLVYIKASLLSVVGFVSRAYHDVDIFWLSEMKIRISSELNNMRDALRGAELGSVPFLSLKLLTLNQQFGLL